MTMLARLLHETDHEGPSPGLTFGHTSPSLTERGLAWFRIVDAAALVVFGSFALVKFYQSRYILDIRTRSAYLVVFTGAAILLNVVMVMNNSINLLSGWSSNQYLVLAVLFFTLPITRVGFICRVIRLAVVFHPKAKHDMPWLIPEKNHIAMLLGLGICFIFGHLFVHSVHDTQMEVYHCLSDILRTTDLTIAALLAALYPLIRNVDDLFSISKELAVVMAVRLTIPVANIVSLKVGNTTTKTWISADNIDLVMNNIIFIISVIEPMWRLMFDPLAAAKRKGADRVILSRSKNGSSRNLIKSLSSVRTSGTFSEVSIGCMLEGPAVEEGELWDFERLASTPMLANAFEEFARKALCYENILFLSDVARYREGDYTTASTLLDKKATQFEAFSHIVRTYIANGAPEEVNISHSTKSKLIEIHSAGEGVFMVSTHEQRAMAFDRSYRRVCDMLEANLLQRFIKTKEFKSILTKRENLSIMMNSPAPAMD